MKSKENMNQRELNWNFLWHFGILHLSIQTVSILWYKKNGIKKIIIERPHYVFGKLNIIKQSGIMENI